MTALAPIVLGLRPNIIIERTVEAQRPSASPEICFLPPVARLVKKQLHVGVNGTRIYLYQSSPMWKTLGLHHVKMVSWSTSGSRSAEKDSSSAQSGRREMDGNLGELCRGISEQVQVFGDKQRA